MTYVIILNCFARGTIWHRNLHKNILSLPSFKVKVVQEELYCFKKMVHRDRVSSKCDFMLTSHESTHIRDRPTLKSSEQF